MDEYSHWHYIAGYLIILTNHNWPIFVSLAMALYSAIRLYLTPNRRRVRFFFGWVVLGLAYEYTKHLGDELVRPVYFLFTTDWAWMVPTGDFLVRIVPVPLLIVLAVALFIEFPNGSRQAPKRGPTYEVRADA